MKPNRRLATWAGTALGIVLALALNLTLARAADENNAAREEFHQTYPLSASGRVDLENINGSVHISVWDSNQVKVDAVKTAGNEKRLKEAEIKVNAQPDAISISTQYNRNEDDSRGNHDNPASVEYTLTVPRNARLDEIRLINGGLDVTGVAGEIRASCINGKLVARNLSGEAKLGTINGPLEAEFTRLATRIDLSSVNGPVHLTMPSDTKARIEATTVHGGIDNDFGLHVNHHQWVGHDLNGELGEGGPQIKLLNVNGTIDIRHANDGHAISPAKDLGPCCPM